MIQSLNISDVADKQFTGSIDLKQSSWWTEDDAEVHIQYVDTSGYRQSIRVLTSAGGTYSTDDWTTVTGSVTLPSDARKVIGITVESTGYAYFYADNVQLFASGVTLGMVPVITGVSPDSGPYGTTVTIEGTDFGSTSTGCEVLIGSSPHGITVLDWADTSIQVGVNDPVMTGKVDVDVDFVVAEGDSTYTVTSPYYTISIPDSYMEACQGEIVRYCVWVNMFNGFSSPGGISFSLTGAPSGVASFTPVPVHWAGGTELTIDTSTLTPGFYSWQVDADDGVHATRRAFIALYVVTVAGIEWQMWNPGSGEYEPVTEVNATQQGAVYLDCVVTDSDGWTRMPSFLSITPSDPSKLLAFEEEWGGYSFYAMENGDADLTASTPDGHSAAVTVHTSFPSVPSCSFISATPSPVTNDGVTEITFTATTTNPYQSVGWYFSGFDSSDGDWSPDGYTFTCHGTLQEGTAPGDYMFFSGPGSYAYPFRPTLLTVVNDPSRGQVKGRVYSLGGSMPQQQEVSGTFELYDTAGEKVLEREIDAWSGEYVVSYLPPGTYLARFLPYEWSNLDPQWYADAQRFDAATPIQVVAGQTLDDINFFLQSGPIHVLSTSPTDGARCAPTDFTIIAYLDKQPNPDTVNESTFFLQDSEGNLVPGEAFTAGSGPEVNVRSDEGFLVVFEPSDPLDPGATYTATLTTGIETYDGATLESDYVWSFTTGRNLVSDLKSIPDGEAVELDDKVMYCVYGDIGYIEEPDRSSGIRVEGLYGEDSQDVIVYVYGTKQTTEDGEPYIDLEDYWTDYYYEWIAPFGANSKAVKASVITGLKVRVWGVVKSVDFETPSYVISDAGSEDDGILVYGDCPVKPGEFTCVNGAAGGGASRVIYATWESTPE